MGEKSGGEIPINLFDKSDPKLNTSYSVGKAIELAKFDGEIIDENKKKERLKPYLGEGGQLEKIFNNPNEEDRQRRVIKYKEELLYPEVLIDKDHVPDSYFDLQIKIARERGETGDLDNIQTVKDIPQEVRRQIGETLYRDQKKSLDNWVDYLASPDASYPTWFKYYVLTSVTRMGVYNKTKHEFSKRTKDTTTIFPDLNREAISYTYDVLKKYYLKHEKHDNDELNRILDSANFSKIYAFAVDKVTPASKENKEKTEGEWTKFNQGDDHIALYESLQGHGTGWCTAGEETAETQLGNGDFYVYYTKDEKGQNTIPRIAIRMEKGQVAEVRGIDSDQNIEANMIDIAKEKYHQLPGGEKFDKKDADMKYLTLIDKKVKNNQELTKEELIFLYEIDGEIEGFGYKKDPRIEEILSTRNKKVDYSLIFDCEPDEISFTKKDAINGNIKFHFGDLDLTDLTSIEGLKLPDRKIFGSLILSGLTNVRGLKFPDQIGGDLNLSGLISTEGLELPTIIEGSLYLSNLESFGDLKSVFTKDMEGKVFKKMIRSVSPITRFSKNEINNVFDFIEQKPNKMECLNQLLEDEYNFYGDNSELIIDRVRKILKSNLKDKNQMVSYLRENFTQKMIEREQLYASVDNQRYDEESVLRNASKIIEKLVANF